MTANIDYTRIVRDAGTPIPNQNVPPRDYARNEILKNLDRVGAYGATPWQIFDDWLDLVLNSLKATRDQFKCALDGTQYQEPKESIELFQRLRHRYHNRQEPFDYFSKAMAELWRTTYYGYWDTIGDCYMEWGTYNKWNGQFFTPFHVASMMASMMGSPADEVQRNLSEAISKSIPAQARLLAGLAYSAVPRHDVYLAYFITRVLPHALEHYKPVAVHDPACGSGVMFLAYAQITPPWMLNLGLVQFYGQDIDQTCVKMAQINSLLYGLNGTWAPMFFMEQAKLLAAFDAGDLKMESEESSPMPTVVPEPAPPVVETAVPEPADVAESEPEPKPEQPEVDPRLQEYLQGLDQQHVQLSLFNTNGGK